MWGFDDSAVAVLQGMKQSSELEESQASEVSSLEKYAILLKGGHSASVLSSNITQQKSSTMRLQKVCVNYIMYYFYCNIKFIYFIVYFNYYIFLFSFLSLRSNDLLDKH